METTPQKIDKGLTGAEIERHMNKSLASMDFDALEKRALKDHPPVFRKTQSVPTAVREVGVALVKLKRQPKRKQHVLP